MINQGAISSRLFAQRYRERCRTCACWYFKPLHSITALHRNDWCQQLARRGLITCWRLQPQCILRHPGGGGEMYFTFDGKRKTTKSRIPLTTQQHERQHVASHDFGKCTFILLRCLALLVLPCKNKYLLQTKWCTNDASTIAFQSKRIACRFP